MSALVAPVAAFPLMIVLLFGAVGAMILMIKLFKKQPWVGAVVGVVLLLGLMFFLLMSVVAFERVETTHGTQHVRAVGGALPMMLIVVLALAGVVALLVKVGKKQPWVAAIVGIALLGLPLFLVLGHFVYFGARNEVDTEWPGTAMTLAEPAVQDDVAIWTPGIEDQLKANVYPSNTAAVRSLGLRIDEPVRNVLGDGVRPSRVIVFKGSHNRALLDEFGRAAGTALGGVQCDVEPESVAVEANEVAVRLDLVNVETEESPWSGTKVSSGEYQAIVLGKGKEAEAVVARYVDKPWAGRSGHITLDHGQPGHQFMVVKSEDTCLSEAEANSQAMGKACGEITELLAIKRMVKRPAGMRGMKITPDDILQANMVVDRFVQSLDGSAGKIWRQATLIDVTPKILGMLADRKLAQMRVVRVTWAKMLGSIAGLIALIVVVYLFLNAATKGYYAWSLRIVGVVLAGVVILFFLV